MKHAFFPTAIAFSLLLTGCGNTAATKPTVPTETVQNVTEVSQEMADNRYSFFSGMSFQETDAYFCGSNLSGSILHYFDKGSGISGVLCSDPACIHDSPSCGAYVEAGSTLSIRDGMRYYIAKDPQEDRADLYLWKSELSGSKREKVKPISFDQVILPYQPQQYVVHQGRLYLQGQSDVVQDGKTGYRVTLLSSPLDGSENFTALFDETVNSGVQTTVRFVSNAVYFSIVTFPEGGPFHLKVIRFDTSTGASETVYEESEMSEIPGEIWVSKEGDIYLPGTDSSHAYVWKLGDNARTERISWSSNGVSMPEVADDVIVYTSQKDGVRWVDAVNLSGDVLYSGKLFSQSIPELEGDPNEFSLAFVGGDSEKLIFNLQSFTENGLVDATVLFDLHENMKPTVLWSSLDH